MDMDHRSRGTMGGRSGRIILLGDGTEVLTDSSAESDMFDKHEEDKDLESQVSKGQATSTGSRNEREGTPGPSSATSSSAPAPSASHIEHSDTTNEPRMKTATD